MFGLPKMANRDLLDSLFHQWLLLLLMRTNREAYTILFMTLYVVVQNATCRQPCVMSWDTSKNPWNSGLKGSEFGEVPETNGIDKAESVIQLRTNSVRPSELTLQSWGRPIRSSVLFTSFDLSSARCVACKNAPQRHPSFHQSAHPFAECNKNVLSVFFSLVEFAGISNNSSYYLSGVNRFVMCRTTSSCQEKIRCFDAAIFMLMVQVVPGG